MFVESFRHSYAEQLSADKPKRRIEVFEKNVLEISINENLFRNYFSFLNSGSHESVLESPLCQSFTIDF